MKKYLIKYYYRHITFDFLFGIKFNPKVKEVKSVKIIEEWPVNLSEKYISDLINIGKTKNEPFNVYYDLIPLS